MIRPLAIVLIALLVITDVAPAFAQNDATLQVAQTQRRRTLFDILFGDDQKAPPPVQQQRTQPQPQSQPRTQPRAATPSVVVVPKPEVTKAADATRLAVFGDSMAVDLAKALERFYAEDKNLLVVGEGVGPSGFVRDDFFDWDQAIGQQIAADSFDLAVVIVGVNDRQELRTGGHVLQPLTEQWNTAYQARLADFLGQLRAARKPVIWIGLPPMEKSDYSAAIAQISNIQRLATFSGGAEFLDIYDRFIGEDGKYSAYGPDVSGQNALMRKDDGIHLSAAGSDKLAFYVSQSIRNFYRGGSVTMAVTDPLAGTDAGAMLRPPFQGLGQTRLLEVAGAVVPLSRAPQRANQLLTATTLPPSAPSFSLDDLMQAPVGRVDAFGVGIDPNQAVDEH